VDKLIDLKELQEHLHSLPEQPDAVPYVTSYYKDQWGFCLSHEQRQRLDGGLYRVVIRSKKKPGKLTYGELLIAGRSRNEIFLSTYACHPSMANNELSGPLVFTALAKWLLQRNSYYSYRLFIGPETIGSLTYLSLNLKRMQRRVIAGYVLTCVGDDRQFSYLRSREGGTLSDLAAFAAFAELQLQPKIYDWLDRGSDERQYCSPGIDLPIGSIMRSKYGEFPEYHTNLDRFDSVVTSEGLAGAYKVYRKALEIIENLYYPVAKVKGEPQLSRYGLYASISTKLNYAEKERKSSKLFQNILTYCDGLHSSLEISNLISVSVDEINVALGILEDKGLVKLYRRAKSRL
jgi:aminopeptidase-like protein